MSKNPILSAIMGSRIILVAGIFLFFHTAMLAQEEGTAPVKKEKARISLGYTNFNNTGPRLIATVKSKIDKVYQNIQGVKVNFYLDSIDRKSSLGYAVTGDDGRAVFIIPESLKKIIAKRIDFLYIATIENDDRFKDKETEIEVMRSHVDLNLKVQDSVRWVHFLVEGPDSAGNNQPVANVAARIYIQRLFGLLPISDALETTGSDGKLSIQFPDDLPGDEKGNLEILAKVEDHEDFGTLVATQKIDWGIPLAIDESAQKRELWSARANTPIPLVLIISFMVIGIWGIIGYIFYQLVKINKMGNTQIEISESP